MLRGGGRLALTCWSYPPSPALGLATEAIAAAGVAWPEDVPVAPFRRHSSPEAFAALLGGAGFGALTARMLSWEHRMDPREWWEKVYLARVGANGVVIGRQDAATVARISEEFDRLAAPYAVEDGQVALPAVAVLASGQR